MGKVVITADFDTCEINLKVDGESFDNVASVSICCYEDYNDEDKMSLSVSLEPEKVSHLTKNVYISSAGTKEAKAAIARNSFKTVSQDGKIISYAIEGNLSDSVAKMLGKEKNT